MSQTERECEGEIKLSEEEIAELAELFDLLAKFDFEDKLLQQDKKPE